MPDAIERVELDGAARSCSNSPATPNPQTGLEGKFSVYHAVSAAIVYGAAGEAQFSDACVRDPRVVALRKRVSLREESDTSVRKPRRVLPSALATGAMLSLHVEHALGTLARPMSDADLEAKFRGLARG